MTMENWNPYRKDDDYIQKHYGVKSRAQLYAAAIVFGCLIIGALVMIAGCIINWK